MRDRAAGADIYTFDEQGRYCMSAREVAKGTDADGYV
jgi:hypothetical protein